jgi:release factor glutamine methyltransferase
VIGTDISEAALTIARENLARIAPPHPVTFLRGSLAEPIQAQVDLVLANLPYLTPAQIAGNHDLDAEPRVALDGGAHGLDLVNELIQNLPHLLKPAGAAGFELDPGQCHTVRSALAEAFPDHDVRIMSDLGGHARHVVMRIA